MQISKINFSSINKPNIELDKQNYRKQIAREILQKQNNQKYQEDLFANKLEVGIMGGFSAVATALCIATKEFKKEHAAVLGISWFLTLLAVLTKPKKENYDKQVEMELKKEMENKNI